MAKLIYTGITSLDGYIEDREGNFDWSAPDDEVHTFINANERLIGTFLLGRRMYEVMVWWETLPLADEPPAIREFARIWKEADKVVYSTTLDAVSSTRTSIERGFDPGAVRQLKEMADRDIGIAGPDLASHAIRAGLVDEYRVYVTPMIVGGGKQFLPDDVRLGVELLEERRFASGVVYLRYRTRS
ncbi:dihydrofolate reductase family protein [Arthrobacter rhizosphaerae]|uniref:dihydrofolate reductase family protein n=1 Tax=Arthrobacter rhizosphaerae TaxID=2855490 RepID=UPI001FF35060|nr:dihydrofolate reductase family protein [Arthrobacter rhizosphaerae]